MLVDSHCHLDFNDFDEDFEEMLERARDNGVTAMLNACLLYTSPSPRDP